MEAMAVWVEDGWVGLNKIHFVLYFCPQNTSFGIKAVRTGISKQVTMYPNDLQNENRALWFETQGLKEANALLKRDLDTEKRAAYECHAKLTHHCRELEGQLQALKADKTQETDRLSEMLKTQVVENRRLTFEKQRLLEEVEGLKQARASDHEQSKAKLAELEQKKARLSELEQSKLKQQFESTMIKGVADSAVSKMLMAERKLAEAKEAAGAQLAEADRKLRDAQNELQQVKVELAESRQSVQNLAELKQSLSERMKSFAAQNAGLKQTVLELQTKKRPSETPSPQAKVRVVAQSDRQSLEDSNAELTKANAELTKANAELTKANAKLSTENAGRKIEDEVLRSYNERLEERLAHLKKRLAQREEQVAKINGQGLEEKLAHLKKQLAEREEQLAKINGQGLKEKLAHLQKQLAEREGQLAKINKLSRV
jgi:chromosome segregation ATPase